MSAQRRLILGIETSCDETACSIVDDEGNVLSNVVYTQIEMHKKYGGIVPELASRDHALKIEPVVVEAISNAGLKASDITHLGVSCGPGLLGCLLVGISFSKAFCMANNIPLIGVDHIKAHVMSIFIKSNRDDNKKPSFPFLGLVVSGGHTTIYLVNSHEEIIPVSSTVDDAAGEVFDKVARYLGLGYPGGKVLSDIAKTGDALKVKFPKPVVKDREDDFSFSGLKTAAINYFRPLSSLDGKFDLSKKEIVDGMAGVQEAICSTIVDKLIKVAKQHPIKDIVIGGGVAANYRLRELLKVEAEKNGFTSWAVPVTYCTDNGTMIANMARLTASKYPNKFTNDMAALAAYSTTRK